MLQDMIVLDWSPNFSIFKIAKCFIILKWWKNIEKLYENQEMCSTCWPYEPLCMYVEYISNKNGYSGSFYVNYLYFKTFYFVLKWVKARKLPHFIFIMLCFKTAVATPGYHVIMPTTRRAFRNLSRPSATFCDLSRS
jgi:hypothetical protein